MKKLNNKITFSNIMGVCISILKHNYIYHILNLIIWLFLSVLPIISGYIIKNLFDSLNFTGYKSYYSNLILLSLLLLANIFFTYQGGIYDAKSRFYIGKFLRSNLFNYFTSVLTMFNNSSLLNMFNTDIDIIEEFISFTMDFFNKVIYFLFSFYILSSINLSMTIYIFIPLLLASIFIYTSGTKIKNHYFQAKQEDLKTTTFISSIIEGHSCIRYFNPKKGILKHLSISFDKRKQENLKKEVFFEAIERFTELFNNLSYVLIMISSIYFIPLQNGVGDFMLFIEYISYSATYLLIFQDIFIKYKSIEKFLENLKKQTDLKSNNLFNVIKGNISYNYKKLELPLRFTSFALHSSMKPINFEINKGDIFIITGKIGVGKTQFINCILNNVTYYGNISTNSQVLSKDEIPCVNYVPQNSILFDDTLINNIICYDKYDEKRFNDCLEICQLKEKVFNDLILNKSKIGKNGKKLSEGQRQRVTLARALYANNNIFILDNCFANIDISTKNAIINKLIERKYTIIITEDNIEYYKGKIKFKNLIINNNSMEICCYE